MIGFEKHSETVVSLCDGGFWPWERSLGYGAVIGAGYDLLPVWGPCCEKRGIIILRQRCTGDAVILVRLYTKHILNAMSLARSKEGKQCWSMKVEMAELQHNVPQSLQRSTPATHPRLNGRRRVFSHKLATLQKMKDRCPHPASSSFLPGFHVRVARVRVTCTYLLSGYDRLESPELCDAQLADQSRHEIAQKKIAAKLRQADRPAQRRRLFNRASRRSCRFRWQGLKDSVNLSPIISCFKSWLQQPFVHLARMASLSAAKVDMHRDYLRSSWRDDDHEYREIGYLSEGTGTVSLLTSYWGWIFHFEFVRNVCTLFHLQ